MPWPAAAHGSPSGPLPANCQHIATSTTPTLRASPACSALHTPGPKPLGPACRSALLHQHVPVGGASGAHHALLRWLGYGARVCGRVKVRGALLRGGGGGRGVINLHGGRRQELCRQLGRQHHLQSAVVHAVRGFMLHLQKQGFWLSHMRRRARQS